MIWLYHADNTDYDHNGDCALTPTICEASSELNGRWELPMQHPIDPDGRFKQIQVGAVLSVPTHQGERQRYRIYEVEKSNTEVMAYARPIFYDAGDAVYLVDKRPTDKNGQEALDILLEGTGYRGKSNITKISTAYYQGKNLLEAIQGDEENSFLNRWGGEILYKNEEISINDHVGQFNGVRAEFGHNLESISEKVSTENTITRIIPVAYNGYTLPGDTPWVDSPNIDKYPVVFARRVEYPEIKLKEDAGEEEEGYETLEELREALIKAAENDFAAGCDLPEVSYDVNMADLSQKEEYRDYVQLEKVNLGDSVYCRHAPLGIEVLARVVAIKWDCVLNRVAGITLGNYQDNYFDQLTSTYSYARDLIDRNGNLIANRVVGVMDAMQVQLRQQLAQAEKYYKPALLFEILDPEDPLYGAMAMGTQGWMIAKQRKENGEWDWRTAATANGIVADLITAGTMLADRIKGGVLTLGGLNNENGRLELKDKDGNIVGTMDVEGVKLAGELITGVDGSGNKARIAKGLFEILDNTVSIMQVQATSSTDVDTGRKTYNPQIYFDENCSGFSLNFRGGGTYRMGANGAEEEPGTVTGRAELSDGTYFEIKCGRIVGGKTKDGTEF